MKRWFLLLLLSGVAFMAQAEKPLNPCSNPQGYSSDMDAPNRDFVPLYHQVPTVWLDWLSAGRPMDLEES